MLNNYFDKIFCINLPHRTDRRQSFKREAERIGFSFSFVDGIICESNGKINKGNLGNLRTVGKILRESILENYKKILIFEDDCAFRDELLPTLKDGLDSKAECDILYLGGSYFAPNAVEELENDKNFNRAINLYATHSYSLCSNVFRPLLERIERGDKHIDMNMVDLQKEFKALVFKRNICIQTESYSDIVGGIVNYKEYMEN